MIGEAILLQKIEIKLQQKLAEKMRKAKAKIEKRKTRKTITDPTLPEQIKLLNEGSKVEESSDSS